jgi:N-acetylglucosaminyl-diphospho-decaprenol L-rhamnosyltransferase
MIDSALGLVVVGYQSDAVWDSFFSSLATSDLLPSAIVVVENGPTVAPALDPETSPPLTILHRPDNPGYGAAINAGVKLLPGGCEWVAIANPDVTLSPTALAVLLGAKDNFPGTAILGPQIQTASGQIYPSARAIPGIRIGIGHALLGNIWPRNPWTLRYLGAYGSANSRTAGWLSGAFLVVNRAAFMEIGGFDENYFMFFEDVDLGFRAKAAGYRSVYVPSAMVTHSGAHATRSSASKMVMAHHRSAEFFLAKLYPKRIQGLLRFALSLGLRLRAVIESRRIQRATKI